ncbi:hypothetical protein Bca4012_081766 [Brassica carinata]
MDTMEVEDFRVENTVLKAVVAIDSKVEIVLVMDTKVVDGVLEVAVDTIVEVKWWIQGCGYEGCGYGPKMDTMEVEDFRMGNTVVEAMVALDSRVGIVMVMDTEVVVDGMVEVVKIL